MSVTPTCWLNSRCPLTSVTVTSTIIYSVNSPKGKLILKFPGGTLLDLVPHDIWSDIVRYYYRTPLFAIGNYMDNYPGYRRAYHEDLNIDLFVQWYRENKGLYTLGNIWEARDRILCCLNEYTLSVNEESLILDTNIDRGKFVLLKTMSFNEKKILYDIEKLTIRQTWFSSSRQLRNLISLFVPLEFK